MIPFACPHCGMKLQVRAEFAGRSGPCPTCKGKLTVPQASAPLVVPTGAISGPASSLHQAGLDDRDGVGVTLDRPVGGTGEAAASGERSAIADLLAGRARTGGRYVIEKEIARGGMGAVVRAVDCDIRREVAVKYMLDDRDFTKKARFVEEAQITGQLEHPNIVPIHELGVDAEKRFFFAMKMVRGRSLAQVLDELRKNPAAAERNWTLGRLLTIMTNVCYAMSYAHARGVIHRDLKPANIMLGDFGETYVMDWGLAKVVAVHDPLAPQKSTSQASEATSVQSEFTIKTKTGKPASQTVESAAAASPLSTGDDSGSGSGSSSAGKVVTSRELEGELTQEGAIMGTPSYMSPEQARGEVHALDARSDIYSLAAILYEMLTLASPIEKEGGSLAILTRVVEGKIKPPEVRTPERAKSGKIPKELAAVAMKGLALRPENRYYTAEGLRRDIERFQEGRSVSAKQDTPWEATVKFVRRNKAFSAATGTAVVVLATVLAVAFQINNAARVQAEEAKSLAEQNYENFEAEQKAKNQAIRNSIPGTLRAARQLANDGAVPEALAQITLVRSYDPRNLDAHLLQGQIFVAQRKFAAALPELTYYLQHKRREVDNTEFADAAKLYRLAVTQKTDDLVILYEAAGVLQRQNLFRLTPLLLQDAAKLREARRPLADLYTKQTKALWNASVGIQANGELFISLSHVKTLTDLQQLKGMQFNRLDLAYCENLTDLGGVEGMPLTHIHFPDCPKIASLEPLRGAPLRYLDCLDDTLVSDLEPLRGMPLEHLNFGNTAVGSLEPLVGMPLRHLVTSNLISDLSPLRGMQLDSLSVYGTNIGDLEPLRGMPCVKLHIAKSVKLTSIEPLRGMLCKDLALNACPNLESLEPLRGMPCETLNLSGAVKITDLSPLRGMPLKTLNLSYVSGCDLAPLAESPLVEINFNPKRVTGVEALRAVKTLARISVGDGTYAAAEFWKRYDAGEFKK